MNIKQFNDKLAQAKILPQLEKVLAEYLSHFQFNSYAITFYAGHTRTGQKIIYDYVSPALQIWHDYYLEHGFADADRTLDENSKLTLPLFWQVREQLQQAKNPREKLLREESIQFGIDKGLSLPVHGPNNEFLTWTLHQRKGETCLTHYENMQYEWLSAAQVYYHYLSLVLSLQKTPVAEYHLSKREQQCLQLTAKSWRIEQIAKELKITPRTVNFHLQNANKKMGTHSKYLTLMKYLQSKK